MKHSNATQQIDILNKEIIQQTFHKLLPQHAFKNPVMACVWVGTVLSLVATLMGNASLGFIGHGLICQLCRGGGRSQRTWASSIFTSGA